MMGIILQGASLSCTQGEHHNNRSALAAGTAAACPLGNRAFYGDVDRARHHEIHAVAVDQGRQRLLSF